MNFRSRDTYLLVKLFCAVELVHFVGERGNITRVYDHDNDDDDDEKGFGCGKLHLQSERNT